MKTPSTTARPPDDASLPDDPADGDYNVLLLGDARILPVPSTDYRDGVSWAIINDGDLDVRDRWMPPHRHATALVNDGLDEMASSSTLRAGRLLAPMAIRFVVIPRVRRGGVDGPTIRCRSPPGLSSRSRTNSTWRRCNRGFPTLEVFENSAWMPTTRLLHGAAAEASETAGPRCCVRTDLSDVVPMFVGADQFEPVDRRRRPPASCISACPSATAGRSTVDGESVDRSASFGVSTAFDVTSAGQAELEYETSRVGRCSIALQVVLWAAAIFVAVEDPCAAWR